MMKSVRLLLIVLVLCVAAGAQADEIWTTYYNCSMSAVGGSLRECDNGFTTWQQQSGAFKSVERYTCDPITAVGTDWYEWNGSSWVLLSGEPSPSC